MNETVKKVIVAALLSMLPFALVGFAHFASQLVVTNVGTFASEDLGLYEDAGCTTPLTAIDWQVIYPSETKQHPFYVKNEGTVPLVVTMTPQNWQPSNASTYLTSGWNRENTTINAGEVLDATAFLTASASPPPYVAFSFDMYFDGV